MQIAVLANDEQWMELLQNSNEKTFVRIDSPEQETAADAFLILKETGAYSFSNIQKPILINSVVSTLTQLGAGKNVWRINGWPGFIQRHTWELAGMATGELKAVFAAMNKQMIEVKDEPGFVAARTISMIINEAYFALNENVSTKQEIDIAMKLGTNYPYGPFEWAEKIGVAKVFTLLKTLAVAGKRYTPAASLEKEACQ